MQVRAQLAAAGRRVELAVVFGRRDRARVLDRYLKANLERNGGLVRRTAVKCYHRRELEHTFFQTDLHKVCSKISACCSEIKQSWHHSCQNH